MLHGRHKAALDRQWVSLADVVVKSGIRPNQVTCVGLVLVLGNCVLYPLHESNLVFGVGLAFSFAFDALDGAVARLTGRASRFGAYLDAVVDRYQEVAVYLTIGLVTGFWLPAVLALTGSMLVSYNKARTALEVPIGNNEWPDLMERFERIVLLCLALVLDAVFAGYGLTQPSDLLYYFLWAIGVLAHITAVQRFFRARRIIAERGDRPGQP